MNAIRTLVVAGACAAVLAAAACAPAETYTKLLAKAEQSVKQAKEAGKSEQPAPKPEKPYTPTAADQRRGLVVCLPPLTEHFVDRPPVAGEVQRSVRVRAARGEIESLLLGVHAVRDQKLLSWSAGRAPAGVRVEFLPVVMAPMAQRRSEKYPLVGLWLAEGGAVDVEAGHTRAWVVRVHVSEQAKAGDHELRLGLTGAQASELMDGVSLRLQVLPFKLADPWQRKYVFGAFCAGADFTVAQYREMKAHGIESILWFWGHYGMNVRNDGGKVKLDLADLDATVARMKQAGLRGPIVLALGNDSCGHFERAICRAFDLPMQPRVQRAKKVVQLAVLDDPKIEQLMVDALRQLFDNAKAKKYPEIVILPYDEPTERLMKEHRRMVGLFRKHFPHVRLYGVTMNRLRWAEMVSDTDILVANGDFARIRKLADEKKLSAWFYGGCTTAQGYASCRWRYGLQKYAYGADGSWFWCYNFHPGDPWNDFDSHTADSAWVIRWPPLAKGGGSVETLAYEGLREAVDDVRYAMTLEEMLKAGAADAVAAEYRQWRKGLQSGRPKPAEILAHRDRLIDWLLKLQKQGN